MDDKRFTYFFIGFIVVVFLSGGAYFVLYFSTGKKENKVEAFESFAEKKGVYGNKKKAYDDLAKDSLLNARSENVRVNLSSVFGKKVQTEDQRKAELIPNDKEQISEDSQVHPKPQVEPCKSIKKIQKQNTVSQHKEPMQFVHTNVIAQSSETKPQMTPSKPRSREGFFSSFSDSESPAFSSTVNAVVHSQQEVYEGATVKLRITSSCNLASHNIPTNTFIYGVASISNERVEIKVNSIAMRDNILSVHLSAFDKDGISGIYIPGLAIHEAKKEGVDEAINEATARLNVPVVGSVPLHVARNRNNVVTAILTDGYRIILK